MNINTAMIIHVTTVDSYTGIPPAMNGTGIRNRTTHSICSLISTDKSAEADACCVAAAATGAISATFSIVLNIVSPPANKGFRFFWVHYKPSHALI